MRRKVLLVLLVSTLLVSLLGCARPRPRVETAGLASYMPADTALFLAVQLRPEGKAAENWRRVRDAFASIPAVKKGLDEQAATMKKGLPFDWKADIEPWLGKSAAVGLTDLGPLWQTLGTQSPTDLQAGKVPPPPKMPFLLVVEVRDSKAFASFQTRLEEEVKKAGGTFEGSAHGGATIYTVTIGESQFAFALRDGRVLLVADESAGVAAALDRQEKDSLAASADFKALLSHLPGGGLVLGYAAAGPLTRGLEGALSGLFRGAPLPAGGLTGGAKASGFTLLAEAKGLRIESASTLDLAALAEAGLKDYYDKMRQPHPGRVLEFMPKNAALVVASRDLKGAWEMLKSQVQKTNPEALQQLQGGLEDLKAQTGLDIENDVLSWMNGEFGLFLAPGDGKTPAGVPAFRLGLIFEVGDMATAEATMKKIEGLLTKAGEPQLSFADQEIEGVKARVIPMLQMAGYLPGYAFVDNFLIIAIDRASFEGAFRANKDKGERAAAAPEFAAVMEALPRQKTDLFFLDFVALTGFLDGALEEPERTDFREQVKPFLDLLGGLGAAGAAGKAGDDYSTSTMFLHLIP